MMFRISAFGQLSNNRLGVSSNIYSAICAVLMLSLLSSCAMLESSSVEIGDETEEAQIPTQSPEEQLAMLQEQMKIMQADWEKQKPALGRLMSSEEDLQFLIKTLSEMSELDDSPSRAAYLGKVEKTPEQADALQTLQSVVDNQDQLLAVIKGLSEIIEQTKASRSTPQFNNLSAATEINSDNATFASPATDGMSVDPGSANKSSFNQTVPSGAAQAQSNCACDSTETNVSTSQSSDTIRKSTEWFGITEPLAEAEPAGSKTMVSQLDSAEVLAGAPIPGLNVKRFKRKNLPSEMAAAGIDMKPYISAPQFKQSRKSLSDYVSQLAFKLAGNQQLVGNKVGVASFVFFDEQLEQTSSVGNQLAEQLSTVLPEYGALVVEYKLTREITVSPAGDLSLSRNVEKLRDLQGMDYVLTGTMVPTNRGLQINSRVVSTRNNLVIASATTLIPAILLGQL
jgi:TolB-like protein